ncbi:hypothetical protein EJB05_41370, partial [Eragrostis curvula]
MASYLQYEGSDAKKRLQPSLYPSPSDESPLKSLVSPLIRRSRTASPHRNCLPSRAHGELSSLHQLAVSQPAAARAWSRRRVGAARSSQVRLACSVARARLRSVARPCQAMRRPAILLDLCSHTQHCSACGHQAPKHWGLSLNHRSSTACFPQFLIANGIVSIQMSRLYRLDSSSSSDDDNDEYDEQ